MGGGGFGFLDKIQILEGGDFELRQTVLGGAVNLPGTAQLQINFGQFQTGEMLFHGFQPGSGRGGKEQTIGLPVASAYPAAELVQLGQAKTLGGLDKHNSG